MAKSILVPAVNSIPLEFQDNLPPTWDPLWHATPSNILLKAAQDAVQHDATVDVLLVQSENLHVEVQPCSFPLIENVDERFPQSIANIAQAQSDINKTTFSVSIHESYSLDEIQAALYAYYKPHLTIQRVSGDKMDLDSCYVNLAIVEAPYQRQRDKEEMEAQVASFHRMASYEKIAETNMKATIPLEEIFDWFEPHYGGEEDEEEEYGDGCEGSYSEEEEEEDEASKTILVQGRAGIGKTTLCKKLVHAYQSGLWRDRFDAVLWLLLRQLKTLRVHNLDDLFREKYFAAYPDKEKASLTSALAACARDGRVLFILDGLDEIVIDTQTEGGEALEAFLKHLLQQDYVIVTSRPSGVDKSILPELDLELETVGFSAQDVKKNLNHVLTPEATRAVHDFILRTPLIQDLVNTPVQLDVICYGRDSLPSNEDSVTMARLYQMMVRKLWCKDAVRLQKSPGGKQLSPQQIKSLRPYKIDQLMAIENEYLGYLAFKGMYDGHRIEFDEPSPVDVLEELDQYRDTVNQSPLPFDILDSLKQTSFLHTADTDMDCGKDHSRRAWYFLHLTFQEYFASTWIVRNLTYCSTLMTTIKQTIAFIRQHKYDPRYEIVWWMVSGLLEGKALDHFFDILQDSPRDLVGARHNMLMARCLKEA
ncbi:hypothetical protein BGX26_001328 [Mortierella sp. AD094]|nr:hypothetical protein BGX26_001328 [Mortierella sp. AD094]